MITVQDLIVRHPGDIVAVDGISLAIAPGEHVALMGANGSGKTSLLRSLNGLQAPSSGTVTIDGMSPQNAADLIRIRRRVGMVFQNPDDQLVTTSVETEIAFGLENHGLPLQQMRSRIEEMLDVFSLARYRSTPPHLLSGGERQRLAVAAAVALQPSYLLLDEPTALLDPASRRELMALIETICADRGMGIVHVTQSAEEAACAQRLIVLRQGRVYGDDTPARIFSAGHRLQQETGIHLPFAVRCAKAIPAWAGPLPLTLDDLTQQLRGWITDAAPDPSRANASRVDAGYERAGAGTIAKMAISELRHVYTEGLPKPVEALTGIDMKIHPGQIMAIAGASGSGKTTLVQHLNGLLRPTSGRLWLDGVDLADEERLPSRSLRQQVGLIFQFPEAQLFAETVEEDVSFGPQNVGLTPQETRRQAAAALDAVGLPVTEFGHRSPFQLSGGERRRAAIAGVLAMNPQILVLDEPTAGLDASATSVLVQVLRKLRETGHCIVLVSHDMDLIADLSTRLVILNNGSVLFDGPTREAFDTLAWDEQDALIPPAAWRFGHQRREVDATAPALLTTSEAEEYARQLIPPPSSLH